MATGISSRLVFLTAGGKVAMLPDKRGDEEMGFAFW
jgi:hypothetical protein